MNDIQSQTINWMRYPLMLLIVLIHTDTPLLTSMPQWGLSAVLYYMMKIILTFAVPMFFIFSGYWFFRNPETFTLEAYSSKIRKRALTLLVPYVFWNYFVWAFQLLVVCLRGHADWISANTFYPSNILDVIIGWGEGYLGMPKAFQLWFLRDMMIVCLLAPQLYLLLKHRKPYILLIFAAIYLMPGVQNWHPIIQRFPSALLFFSIGAYMGIHKQNMVEMVRRVPMWLSIAITTLNLALSVWQCVSYGRFIVLSRNLFSIVAVVPAFQIASLLVERYHLKPKPFIADSNFFLFALHPLIMTYILVEPLAGHFTNTPLHFWFVYFLELIVPVIVCIILYAVMHKVLPKTTSLITGGRS